VFIHLGTRNSISYTWICSSVVTGSGLVQETTHKQVSLLWRA